MKVYSYKTLINETGNPYIEKDKSFQIDGRRTYTTDSDVAEFVYRSLGIQKCAEEFLYTICLDNKNHLIGCFEISHGTVDVSYCSPREIFQKALMIGAVQIILTHNHPGGDPTPSGADIAATNRVREGGDILGVKLLDHIVVTQGKWCSMRESGYIKY